METTSRRLARVLGASAVEAAGSDMRFRVEDDKGAKLMVNLESDQQRVMVTLQDPTGIVRCSLDMAPVSESFEEPRYPGRITFRVGNQLIHVESEPTLAVELESIQPELRSKSQRLLARAEEEPLP